MVERSEGQIRAIGVLIGSDGISAIPYKEHTSGMITTIPMDGNLHGVGKLPEVKRKARYLARQFETTIFIPRGTRKRTG